MAAASIKNLALNSASVRIRIHLSAFPVTKLKLPDEMVKEEKFAFIGDAYPTARTPGIVEIGEGELETTTVVWKKMLAVLPDQFTEIEFPITANEGHVSLATDYTVRLLRCRILGTKREIEVSEKGGRLTVPYSSMLVQHKGDDGNWKTLARRAGLDPSTSPAGQALGF
jgi:hypothetical protein